MASPPRTNDVDDLRVSDNPAAQRYEALLDGSVVGYAEYRMVQGRLVFFHTEVDPSVEGRGIGGRLAAATLDDVRSRGRKIRVKCPFIAAWLKRHPDYEDLTAS